ncbi:MAG: phosphate regulon sensor histidine kinase PhoR [Peptococcaceae bacterium]|jgi:two-component system phosphate regulon sensor histidine kinase PhoR|nr:MAG: phosphate regulon sensor histidine kinase PhoR [Peptococcaceae bacterium]
MLNKAVKRSGWKPVVSYFFLFLIFFALIELYTINKLNLWSAIFLALFFSALLARILYVRLIRPLEEMVSVTQDMAGGGLDREIRVDTQDEIGALARNINYMAGRLKNTIDDITAEKNRAQAILASMADGVIALDNRGRVLLINPVVEVIFGVTQAESQGKDILRVIRNYDLEQLLNQALQFGQAMQKELAILTPEPRVFRIHVTPLQGSGREQGGVVALLSDITERKKLERMRSEFVANVSHELRTPLTSMRGFLETLLDGAADDPAVTKQFLAIINTETERLSRLIEELLSLSKIEDRKTVPRWQPVEIADVVERVLATFQPRAAEKNLQLKFERNERIPVIRGDPDMLSQVLINLVDNAISYTPDGGEIVVRVAREQEHLRVDVRDNGIGIPAESLPRIFERFYRVDKARSREQGGTGLGLSIVKHIIEVHRGNVQVESRVGKGSTFSFFLPFDGSLIENR